MSAAQYMAALAKGNGIRLARSAAKKQLRAGELTVGEMFALECCGSMRVGQVLESQYGWGPARTLTLLGRLAISPARKAGQLTERQRNLIVEGVNGR